MKKKVNLGFKERYVYKEGKWVEEEDEWDWVKRIIGTADRTNYEGRNMVVGFMKDYYGNYGTIAITLEGSPPAGGALIRCGEFSWPECKNVSVVNIWVMDRNRRHILLNRKRIPHRLSLEKLFARKDVILMNRPE